MTIEFPTVLVTTLFISQIVVCSFVSARRFAQANDQMRQKYPPQEYPKLYPIGAEKIQGQYTQRMALRMGIVGLAILVLVVSLAQHANAYQLAERMLWVAMAQLLPALLLLPQQFGIMRVLKAMPPRQSAARSCAPGASRILYPRQQ